MIAFVVGLVLLVAGYVVYGRFVAATVRPDPSRPTPAIAMADGVDYVPMSTWRVFLVQLLNIAGLGPVFGPIMGALWGPQVFFWVVLGCILGGGVHDFLSGTMSIRNRGAGLPDLIGHYLGGVARHASTFFILLLMLLVGTVFVKGPALLLVDVLPAQTVGAWFGDGAKDWLQQTFYGHSAWLWIVMMLVYVYYLAATLLPIDKNHRAFLSLLLAGLAGHGGGVDDRAIHRANPPAGVHPAQPASPESPGLAIDFHYRQLRRGQRLPRNPKPAHGTLSEE